MESQFTTSYPTVKATWVYNKSRRFNLSNGKHYETICELAADMPFSDRALYARVAKLGRWTHPDLLAPSGRVANKKEKRKTLAEQNQEKKIAAKKKMVDTKSLKIHLQKLNKAREELALRNAALAAADDAAYLEKEAKKRTPFRKLTDEELGYHQAFAYSRALVICGACL